MIDLKMLRRVEQEPIDDQAEELALLALKQAQARRGRPVTLGDWSVELHSIDPNAPGLSWTDRMRSRLTDDQGRQEILQAHASTNPYIQPFAGALCARELVTRTPMSHTNGMTEPPYGTQPNEDYWLYSATPQLELA